MIYFGLFDLDGSWHKEGDIVDCPVMQFTGLKDKNGREIYEGDIIQDSEKETYNVIFNKGQFALYVDEITQIPIFLMKKIRVIGNIYENLELLK